MIMAFRGLCGRTPKLAAARSEHRWESSGQGIAMNAIFPQIGQFGRKHESNNHQAMCLCMSTPLGHHLASENSKIATQPRICNLAATRDLRILVVSTVNPVSNQSIVAVPSGAYTAGRTTSA